MNSHPAMITTTLQFVWPIEDPPGEELLTRAEILAHAYQALEAVADEHDCTIMGPPLWAVQAGAVTQGWQTWNGRVLIALVPVEHHPTHTEHGEPLLTRAQWDEVHATEQAAAAVVRAAEEETERAAEVDRLAALDERVKTLHAAGLNDAEITRVIGAGVTKSAVHYSRAYRLGLPSNAKRGPARPLHAAGRLTPAPARVQALRAAGLTVREVARVLGFTTSAIEQLDLAPVADARPDHCHI